MKIKKVPEKLQGNDVSHDWHALKIEPPDEMVEVEDKNGSRALAISTYF